MEEAKKKESGKRLFSLKYFVVFIVIFAVIIIIFLFLNFRTKNCSNIDCFNSAMEKCKRASFINELEDASWLYTINGKKGDLCRINVKLLQVKEGTTEIKAIENLDMDCSLVLGFVGTPNSDLTKCHGELREGLQDLMIKKMHAYILANVGKIGEELNKVV